MNAPRKRNPGQEGIDAAREDDRARAAGARLPEVAGSTCYTAIVEIVDGAQTYRLCVQCVSRGEMVELVNSHARGALGWCDPLTEDDIRVVQVSDGGVFVLKS